jgi:Tfp pilus assembly protein PilF
MTAPGDRSAALGSNTGIVQTGDRAQAWLVNPAVTFRPPAEVPIPPGGLGGLPKPPVRDFIGRDDEIAKLDRDGVIVVYGLAGAGKSELVLQYAAARPGVVWWVNADAIAAGLAELAFRLHPGSSVDTQQEAASWALAWLRTHDHWLLVLDNVEDRALVEPLLGQLRRGHVIITTGRDDGWDDIADVSLHLDVLPPAASARLLTTISGQDDPATAETLARELACLPLALRQAGAYLRQTRISMDRYLRRLRAEPAALLGAVTRTLSLTVAAVTPLAVDILRIRSCLAPENLPRDVLYPLAEPDAVDQALGMLASYSLINLTRDSVAIHRLVQSITPPEVEKATVLLAEAAPTGNPQATVGDWPRWTLLAPHIAALAARTPPGSRDPLLAALLGRAAIFESAQGHHRQALAYQQRALDIDPGQVTYLNNLAYTLWALGRAAEAEELQRRALQITEATLGPGHRLTATRLNNLATTLLALDRPAEAEPLQRRAIAIAETAGFLDNLASSLLAQNRTDEAEQLYRRALARTEDTLGHDHPETATCLINLGGCLQRLGHPAEAESLLRRALTITESALGPDHPTTANCLNNLAHALVQLDRPADAEPLYRRALTIIGPDHPSAAVCRRNLADCQARR